MKRSLIVFVLALAGSAGLHAQEQGAAVETQRDANQQNRIEQGLQSGQLNTREAGHLEREEQHIDRQEAHDLKQGGALTPQEKAQINREQNQVSHDIYRDKHNATTGNPNSASSQRMQADVQRNANQQQRIANGVNNGSLTNKEAGHLEGGQAHVNRAEANAAANGHVGAGEQARIQGKENHQSNRIYDKKHNGKEREN
ncbi:MAG TPA: hypothetical protein VFB32_01605 [Rudaea sp.]|nr:hypothetical protein [Rudaea sp.]